MKKFDRLPPETRKAEIRAAALELFGEKGFAATTMENIVDAVSLSKGGVYRLYPSTRAILTDLMTEGMRLRNSYYEQRVRQELGEGRGLTPAFLVQIIGDSLLLYPDYSRVYVEFLWEKQRDPELEALYGEVCTAAVEETRGLMEKYGAGNLLPGGTDTLRKLTELMNGAVLSLHVLGLQEEFSQAREKLSRAVLEFLT